MEELWKGTQRLVTHSHNADILKQYKYRKEELEETMKLEFGVCQLPLKKMLIKAGPCVM